MNKRQWKKLHTHTKSDHRRTRIDGRKCKQHWESSVMVNYAPPPLNIVPRPQEPPPDE